MNKKSSLIPVLIVVLILFLFIVSCIPADVNGTQPPESITESTLLEYTIIDGMPCLRDLGYRRGGITCDWSQWNGETYIDENGVEQIRIKQ